MVVGIVTADRVCLQILPNFFLIPIDKYPDAFEVAEFEIDFAVGYAEGKLFAVEAFQQIFGKGAAGGDFLFVPAESLSFGQKLFAFGAQDLEILGAPLS